MGYRSIYDGFRDAGNTLNLLTADNFDPIRRGY